MAVQAKCEPCGVFYVWGNPYAIGAERGDDSAKIADLRCPKCAGHLKHGIRKHSKNVVTLGAPPIAPKN